MNAKSETREKVTGMVKAVVTKASRVLNLHLLLKFSMDDDTKAQCVIRLGDGGFRVGEKDQTHKFFMPLTSHGLPYLDRSNKVRGCLVVWLSGCLVFWLHEP